MRRKTNVLLSMSLLSIVEIVTTVQRFKNAPFDDALADVFFMWGILDVLLGLTLIFGFENRMINMAYTKSGNENYIQNVSNFIGSSAKNFFKRETDFSAGSGIFALGLVNLAIYALMLML